MIQDIRFPYGVKAIFPDKGSWTMKVSPEAAHEIVRLASAHNVPARLRVSVLGGGCSGFRYDFAFTSKAEADDIVLSESGAEILVDPESIRFLADAELVFEKTLMRSSLTVRNPNAKSSCGCGVSFAYGDAP